MGEELRPFFFCSLSWRGTEGCWGEGWRVLCIFPFQCKYYLRLNQEGQNQQQDTAGKHMKCSGVQSVPLTLASG